MSQQEQEEETKRGGSNEELIIEQVRSELETYFAPQNLQNDFNLRQKMTTDGYIDISLLLDLKLLNELVSSREVLIEAISRSKLLVMNTGCTMVKYMPILERNILILRDIPAETQKAQIEALFDNDACEAPTEIHSEIGGHWFCRFDTEEHCLSAFAHLRQFGQMNGEPLHVRVKAVHDKNKADTSPQMANSAAHAAHAAKAKSPKSRAPKGSPQNPTPYGPAVPNAYSPGQWYAYYGTGVGAMDPYTAQPYGGYVAQPQPQPQPQPRRQPRSSRGRDKASRSNGSKPQTTPATTGPPITPPPPKIASAKAGSGTAAAAAAAASAAEEETTLVSDYPGVFDKYPMETFLEIFAQMKDANDLEIPQSMRGRDFRIISDDALMPVALAPTEPEPEPDSDFDDDHKDRVRGRGRGRGKARGARGGRGRRRERARRGRGRGPRGGRRDYYEEDMYRAGPYYDEPYYDEYYAAQETGYYGPADAGADGNGEAYDSDGYLEPERADDEELRRMAEEYGGGGGGGAAAADNARGGGRRRRSPRRRNGRSRGQYNGDRRANRRRDSPKGTRQRPETERAKGGGGGRRKRRQARQARQARGVQWAPKNEAETMAKQAPVQQYSTNRGVYRPKAAAH